MQHSDIAGSVLPLPSASKLVTHFSRRPVEDFPNKYVIVEQPASQVMSSSDSLILSSARVKRQASQWGNTARAAPNVFSTFQKHPLVTRKTAVSLKQFDF